VIRIPVPPGVRAGSVIEVPLDGFGIRNLYLRLHVRIDRETRMRTRTLVVIGLASTIGFAAGRGGVPPALVSLPFMAVAPSAAAPALADPVAAGNRGSAPLAAAAPEDTGDLTADERRTVEIFRRASASVVHIANIAVRQDLFSFDVLQIQQGTGSGFVWDTNGHIVTNFHVIEGGDSFKVRLADQSEHPARMVGYAANKDLAVLRVGAPAAKLTPLPLGSLSGSWSGRPSWQWQAGPVPGRYDSRL
jgi:hypothetical protein